MTEHALRLAYLADPNSVHTRRWLAFFAARGHDVRLLVDARVAVRPGLHPAIRLERYDRFGPVRLPLVSSIQGGGALRRLLRRLRPDVLHAHYLLGYGWQARLSGFHPFVASPWGSDLFVAPRRSWRTRRWNAATLRTADLVTANSRYMLDRAVADGARAGRVEIVQFGVDTRRFAPGPHDPLLAARLELPDAPVVLSIRALRPLYRHETIIDAFAGLRLPASLLMTARNADGAYRRALEARIARHGIGDRVKIVDEIAEDDLAAVLRSAAAMVSVPRSDGTPGSVLEAMASGCPLVVSDVPTLRELMSGASGGLLTPVGDANAVRDALDRVLAASADERRIWSHELRRIALECCDYETNMQRMEAHYHRLAARDGD